MSSLNIPNALTNGSTADAVEVQQNFDAIETHTNTEMINRDGSVAMTAQLLLSGAPTSDLGAATKAYADGVLTTNTVQTSFIQDDAVTLAKLASEVFAFLPKGVVAHTSRTTNQGLGTTPTTLMSLTFTAEADRCYKISTYVHYDLAWPGSASQWQYRTKFEIDGVQVQFADLQVFAESVAATEYIEYLASGLSAGSHTLVCYGWVAGAGATSGTAFGSSTQPMQLSIEDIGPDPNA
jgi:hypothetical protein